MRFILFFSRFSSPSRIIVLLQIKDGAVEKTPYSYLKAVVAYAVSLKNQGKLKIMTHAEAYDLWSTATSQPPATIVFTFDDGWRTDCTKVYPLFKS